MSAGRGGVAEASCSSRPSPPLGTPRDSGLRPRGALGTEATATPPLHTRGKESEGGAGQEGTQDRRCTRIHTHTHTHTQTHRLGQEGTQDHRHTCVRAHTHIDKAHPQPRRSSSHSKGNVNTHTPHLQQGECAVLKQPLGWVEAVGEGSMRT